MLDVSEFHHRRVNHSQAFVTKRRHHINGIENQAKRQLRRFNGMTPDNFYWFLKECEWLSYPSPGERCGRHRMARLMRRAGYRLSQRRRWRIKPSGIPPAGTRNHLERDFTATAPNSQWFTDITYIRTAEHWLYRCIVLDVYSGLVDESTGGSPTRRPGGVDGRVAAARLHGSCADNAAAKSFFGVLKREQVNRLQYQTMADARAYIFDYIVIRSWGDHRYGLGLLNPCDQLIRIIPLVGQHGLGLNPSVAPSLCPVMPFAARH